MKRPEQSFQISLVRDLRKILPPDCAMTAFPAGGGGAVRGAFLKAMGLQAGWPDLLFVHRGTAFGLELKAGKGRVSKAQADMRATLAKCGMDVRTARTLDEALGALRAWGIPTRIVGGGEISPDDPSVFKRGRGWV